MDINTKIIREMIKDERRKSYFYPPMKADYSKKPSPLLKNSKDMGLTSDETLFIESKTKKRKEPPKIQAPILHQDEKSAMKSFKVLFFESEFDE